MTVLVFTLVWVVIGAGLTFIAMTGGPKGARQRVHSQTRTGRRIALGLFIAALIGLGILVPALVTGGVEARDTVDNSGIKLTEKEQRGRELFGQRCRICHSLAAANASARVGPNLDQMQLTEGLIRKAINEGKAEGQGQMAADIVDGADEDAVVAFLLKTAGKIADESN